MRTNRLEEFKRAAQGIICENTTIMSEPTPVILSEAGSRLPPSASARDIQISTEIARLQGFRIFSIPCDFAECENADNALAHVPELPQPTAAFWIGYIPDAARYRAIYEAALARNIQLINAPHEHRVAQEFDYAYPLLQGLTPASVTISDQIQAEDAARQLGYPLFIKGCVQSRKARGWKACIAEQRSDLQRVIAPLFELTTRTRGRVVLRQLAQLRYERKSAQGFPLGREFRVFLLYHQVVALGYYWEGTDSHSTLTEAERDAVTSLAITASMRLGVPFVTIDIGQCEDGAWIVIECGDGQFSGLSQVSALQMWSKVRELSEIAQKKM